MLVNTGPGPQSRDHSLANILWRLIWVLWTYYKNMRKCRQSLLEGVIQNGCQRYFFLKLNVHPEQLESRIITLFPLSQPLGLGLTLNYHLDQKHTRWPPSTSWKNSIWARTPTIRYKFLFSTKSTMTIPILTVFVRLNITLTLLSKWLPYVGVKRINKTGCLIQNGRQHHFLEIKFWTRAARIKSTTRTLILTSVWC